MPTQPLPPRSRSVFARPAIVVLLAALAAALATWAWRSPTTATAPAADDRSPIHAAPAGPADASPIPIPLHELTIPSAPFGDPGTPYGVAAAPDGRVAVLDERNARVTVYAADGAPLASFGDRSSVRPEAYRPNGIAFAPDGTLWFVDAGAGVARHATAAGKFLGTLAPAPDGRFIMPTGVAAGPDGTVYVVDARGGPGIVHAFDGTGASVAGWGEAWQAPDDLAFPGGVAVAPDGTVLVADTNHNRVVRAGPDGRPRGSFGARGRSDGQLDRPGAVAAEADGSVLVGDMDGARVQRFRADGAWVATLLAPPAIGSAYGVAALPGGGVVAADGPGAALVWAAAGGGATRTLRAAADAVPLADLVDVAAAPDGAVVALDGLQGKVFRFDAGGRFIGSWGRKGSAVGELSPGQNLQGAVALGPGGDVWVVEADNHRVQRFTPDGTPVAAWGTAGAGDAVGAFRMPSGVAVRPDGSFLVGDTGNGRLQRFGADGAALGTLGWQGVRMPLRLGGPSSLALDGDTLYAVDGRAGRIAVLDLAAGAGPGAPFRAIGGQPWGVCTQEMLIALDVAPAPGGGLDVLEMDGAVVRRGPDGAPVARWAVDANRHPLAPVARGLAADAAGNTYLGDQEARAVRVFGPAPAAVWRAEWFGNRWLAGAPVTVTTVAELDEAVHGRAAPVGEGDGWSVRFTRWLVVEPGRHDIVVQAGAGVRVRFGGATFDAWGERAPAGEVDVRLPAGPAEIVVELQGAPVGARHLHLLFRHLDGDPPPVETPVVEPTLTPAYTPTATPSSTPTATSTPWATALPRRLFLPRAERDTFPGDPTPVPTWVPGGSEWWAPHMGSRAIDIQRIALDLTIDDPLARDVGAVVTETIQLLGPARSVALDAEPEAIRMRAAAVDGRPAGYGWATGPWTPDGISATRLHVSLGRLAPQGTVVTVTLRYAVAHDAMGRGLGLILQPNGEGAPLVQSRSSPYYTRWWLPTNDAPFEVQSVEATLRVPEGWAAAANGAVVGDPATGVGRDAAGHRVFRFVQADPIPSYLIAVAAGAFAVQTEALCLDDPDPSADVDPDAAVPPADCATADRRVPIVRYNAARYDAEVAAMADEVRYLDRHLGPWPHAKLGVIRGPHPYNMEYPGLIALRSFSADVAAHEAAHAWFGNRVRIASWGDFWIKEGLAEFLSRFRAHAYEANACDCDTARLDEARTFDPMRILNLGLRSSGSTPYCKGMAAFVDLTDRLARALGVTMDDRSARVAMLAVLRDLYRAFEGRALTTGDLVGHLRARLGAASTAAGAPLSDAEGAALVDAWARRWLTGTYALR